MKKKWVVIISVIALLVIILCAVPANKEAQIQKNEVPAGKTGTSVPGTNSLGVIYTASLDVGSVNVENEAKTVVVTVKTNIEVELDSLGGIVLVPEGIDLIAMENEILKFTENEDYNLDNGYLAYATADAENITTDYLIKITYSIPTGTPAGDYELGIAINCISKDYGMEMWEEDATAKVTLTVEN